ncbi:MAG: glycosyl transferase, family 2 [Candidatus Solibacter sp.]|nr:glycosyl transferase, family 2 [Candidatus Solibacter sp.]
MILLAALSLAIWVYLVAFRGRFWRMRPDAPVLALDPAAPAVHAIVPARDEADVVGRAMASLAAQIYPGDFQITLVDDHSADDTARLAADAAPGLHIVAARPLPSGWTGKLWAVSEGIAAAEDAEYFLLTDADIVHHPQNVAALVSRARAGNYDLVSYMVRLHCGTFAEHALIPAFVFFFFLLYPPAWIRDPRRGTAGAAGGCILIRRAALESIGGIARIKSELIDDCALAREVKRTGGRIWLGLSDRTVSIRPYTTFAEIGGMISRTAFTQLKHSAILLAGTVAGLAITYLAPPLLTFFAPRGPASGMGALAWLLMTASYWPAVRYYRVNWFWAPMLPAIAVFYLFATLHSAIATWRGQGGMWKGRAQSATLQ